MSQGPRHINTDRSLNRPTEQRPTEASALHQVSLSGQPDFFQNEQPAPQQPEPPRQSAGGGNGGSRPPRHAAPADAPRRRKKKKKTPVWLPMAVTLAVLAVISGVVVYAVNMMNKVEENLKPEENATSLVEEIQTLEEYKGDVVNILVCGIDYEEGRAYSSDGSNDGRTDMILYCQFDIKGGALRMLQIPRNSLVATQNRKITLSNGKTYAATNYQINSVALSNGGDIASLAEVIYDQYKLPIDYYVTIDMLQFAVLVLNVGVIGADIHQAGNALAALAHGHALEQLADLVEDDNGTALHVVTQCKCTHSGNGHQEALVKGLTVLDAKQCLAQHVPADHQIRDAVQYQLHRRGELGQKLEDEHQNQRNDDALQVLFLLFVHTKRSFLRDPWAASRCGGRGFQQLFPIKMDIPRFYPCFPHSFSVVKVLFHVCFTFFPQTVLKTEWKLLKTV